jgi:hypothetical protein
LRDVPTLQKWSSRLSKRSCGSRRKCQSGMSDTLSPQTPRLMSRALFKIGPSRPLASRTPHW